MICTLRDGWAASPRAGEESGPILCWETLFLGLGSLWSIGSDNGPAFVAEITQLVCKAVNIEWKLHTAYRPQSLGMVERMNWTILVTLVKWVQETGAPWMDVLPLCVRIQNDPLVLGHSYEIMFGRPPHLFGKKRGKFIIRRWKCGSNWNSWEGNPWSPLHMFKEEFPFLQVLLYTRTHQEI